MRQDGVTVSHISEKAFKSPEDYQALQYIFEHVEVTPRYDRVARMEETADDRGVPFGWILSTASPMHYIQKQLMGFEQFFFELFDHPDSMAALARSIKAMEDKIFEVMLDAPVDVYRMGGNYDSMMQNPPFFAEHIAPFLKERAEKIHEQGKIFTTHTDGENDGLLELYLESDIDVAESLCPAPMMKLSVKETREVFGDKICIWGGIPSLMMLPGSYSDKAYDAFLYEFYQSIEDGSKLIISVADTVPPEADFNRIKKLIKTAKEFGPVPKR
jgi:uroporphyrinogen-III decarboxylase